MAPETLDSSPGKGKEFSQDLVKGEVTGSSVLTGLGQSRAVCEGASIRSGQ